VSDLLKVETEKSAIVEILNDVIVYVARVHLYSEAYMCLKMQFRCIYQLYCSKFI